MMRIRDGEIMYHYCSRMRARVIVLWRQQWGLYVLARERLAVEHPASTVIVKLTSNCPVTSWSL